MNSNNIFNTDQMDINYLKSAQIGPVLAKALSELYIAQPKAQISFLSKWLLNYSVSQNNQKQVDENQNQKIELIQKFQSEQEQKKKQEQERENKKQQEFQAELDFKHKIGNEDYHNEMIVETFPEYLEKQKHLTGVYVGSLNFSLKSINDEDEGDESAHLNSSESKLINYIGSSISHKSLIRGKTLDLDKGVTAEVFKEREAEIVNDDLSVDGDNKKVANRPTYLYVPDLIKEPRIVYFRLPKLGSYIAIPLTFNSCLNEDSFDKALVERKLYLEAFSQQQEERTQKVQEFENKLKEMTEAGEDTTEYVEQFQAERETWLDVQETEFVTVKKEYVLCADTMGQDREISKEDREYLENYAKLFAESWENKEKNCLYRDIDRQIKYLQDHPMSIQDQVQAFIDQEEKLVEEKQSQFEELKDKDDGKEYNYELECLKLEQVKIQLKDSNFQDSFSDLKNSRVFKFPQILQNIFYLLGHNREDLNVPGTHILNWKIIKEKLNKTFFQSVLEYNHRGEKPNQVNVYALVNRISSKIEKFDQEAVDNYNLCYGRLLRWLKLTCTLRKQDIEIRRAKIESQKIEREAKIEALEKQLSDKQAAIEEKRANFAQNENNEQFNEEEAIKEWEEANPLVEIPPEVQDQIDLDLEQD